MSAVVRPTVSPTTYPEPEDATETAVTLLIPAPTVTLSVRPVPLLSMLKVETGLDGVPYPLPPVKIPAPPAATGPPCCSTYPKLYALDAEVTFLPADRVVIPLAPLANVSIPTVSFLGYVSIGSSPSLLLPPLLMSSLGL